VNGRRFMLFEDQPPRHRRVLAQVSLAGTLLLFCGGLLIWLGMRNYSHPDRNTPILYPYSDLVGRYSDSP